VAARPDENGVALDRAQKAGSRIERELLRDAAYKILKSRIVSGEYEPGTKLSERQLASHLEMSSSPVKAALQRLQLDACGAAITSSSWGWPRISILMPIKSSHLK
jgi:biotin operon repressor